jgi:hypothetical protein
LAPPPIPDVLDAIKTKAGGCIFMGSLQLRPITQIDFLRESNDPRSGLKLAMVSRSEATRVLQWKNPIWNKKPEQLSYIWWTERSDVDDGRQLNSRPSGNPPAPNATVLSGGHDSDSLSWHGGDGRTVACSICRLGNLEHHASPYYNYRLQPASRHLAVI